MIKLNHVINNFKEEEPQFKFIDRDTWRTNQIQLKSNMSTLLKYGEA